MPLDTENMPEDVIRNPENEKHYMAIKPIERRIEIYHGDTLLVRSNRALRVLETGRKVYDAMIYVPVEDIWSPLDQTEKSTHCPLKGDASYFELNGEELAWGYDKALDFAEVLKGHRAFWPDKVRVVEGQ